MLPFPLFLVEMVLRTRQVRLHLLTTPMLNRGTTLNTKHINSLVSVNLSFFPTVLIFWSFHIAPLIFCHHIQIHNQAPWIPLKHMIPWRKNMLRIYLIATLASNQALEVHCIRSSESCQISRLRATLFRTKAHEQHFNGFADFIELKLQDWSPPVESVAMFQPSNDIRSYVSIKSDMATTVRIPEYENL